MGEREEKGERSKEDSETRVSWEERAEGRVTLARQQSPGSKVTEGAKSNKKAWRKGEGGAGTSEGRVATLKKLCFGDRNEFGVGVER